MFQALTDRIDEEILRWIFLCQLGRAEGAEPEEPASAAAPPRTGAARRRPPCGGGARARAARARRAPAGPRARSPAT